MKKSHLKPGGLFLLVALLAAIGFVIVPRHESSIWMDQDFTDWVSPIANQLHGEARLYADGLHIPMPPLPFVLLRLLHPSGALWIDENLLHFLFQAATILLLYWLLCRPAGVRLALVATVALIPIFYVLPKKILYDSMTQFLVVACAGCMAAFLESPDASSEKPRVSPWLMALGLLTSLLLLSKQSTGIGALGGMMLTLLLLPASMPFARRCRHAAVFVFFLIAAFVMLCLAMSPFVSIPGMLIDVFITGSKPKGGPGFLLSKLLNELVYCAELTGIVLLCLLIVSLLIRARDGWWRSRAALFRKAFYPAPAKEAEGWRLTAAWMSAAGFIGVAFFLGTCWTRGSKLAASFVNPMLAWPVAYRLMGVGLAASLVLMCAAFIQSFRRKPTGAPVHPLTPYAIIFFCAALFHSLSVMDFRWTFDNNPLIMLALVFLLNPLVADHDARPFSSIWFRFAKVPVACLLLINFWCWSYWRFNTELLCTETWPEIRHLAGAKLRPKAEGMRSLVQEVRSLTPNPHDSVLLLPNDPNVEAWFERGHPPRSSAIIFADQYWKRYVKQDFARLQTNLPTVIVIGPRYRWLGFFQWLHADPGAERFINLVKDKLIPEKYVLFREHPIYFMEPANSLPDYMDIYIRRDQPEKAR